MLMSPRKANNIINKRFSQPSSLNAGNYLSLIAIYKQMLNTLKRNVCITPRLSFQFFK